MKKILFSILTIAIVSISIAQTTLFTDNFEAGAGNWTLNDATAPGGSSASNAFVVNSDYTGIGFIGVLPLPSQAGSGTSPEDGNYLHITVPAFSGFSAGSFFSPAGDKPFTTMSSDISTVGFTGVELSFYWISAGGTDNVYYSVDAGTTWLSAIGTNFNTNGATWTQATITNAAFDNQATLRFGFLFDDSGAPATDPPFSIDDVKITGVAPPVVKTWTGAVSANWAIGGNWMPVGVPNNCTDDVLIPMGLGTYPILMAGVAGAKDITLGTGATLSVATGAELQVCGDITNTGTISGIGQLTVNGTADQTLVGIVTMATVELNKASNQFIMGAGGLLNVTGQLDMVNGVLKASLGNVVIVSTIAGSGYIDDFSGGYVGTFFAGSNVVVQRYFDNSGTAFHYITSPVGGFNISGYSLPTTSPNGTQVTPNAACDGLMTGSPYGQMFDYRENQVTTCNLEGWHVRTSGVVSVGEGFAAIISDGTTLFAQGQPTTGSVSTAGITSSGVAPLGDGWNLIGNPYPSAIDWALVGASNAHIDGGTAHLYESTGYYDGTYQVGNLISGGNIAHGQAFFVRATSSTNVAFTNAMRTTGDPGFKNQDENYEYLLSLKVEGTNGADKTIIAFDESFTNNADFLLDAEKRESLSGKPTLYTDSWTTKQAIKAIPSLSTDVVVIPMGLNQGEDGPFTISIEEMDNLPARVLVFIEDKETGIFTNLREVSSYSFDVTASSNRERFNIHFVPETEIVNNNETCEGYDGSLTFIAHNFIVNGVSITWNNQVTNIATGQTISDYTNLIEGSYLVTTSFNNYEVEEIYIIGSVEQVTTDFDISKTEVYVGELIQITNNTAGNATYAWDFGNGSTVSNVVNPTYSYSSAGVFEIDLEASTEDCSDNKTISVNVVNKTTAINDIKENQKIKVYMNNNKIYVDLKSLDNTTSSEIKVFSLIGNLMQSESVKSNKVIAIDMSNSSKGYYLVNINNSTTTRTYKVLVK